MASTITIRNVPEPTRNVLAARAAAEGKSLQEYMLGQVNDLAARPTVAEVVARARTRVEASGHPIGTDQILAALRADRDR